MNKKILIVDDDPSISRLLQFTLSRSGFEAHCCINPESFEKIIHSNDFDLLIFDIHLPGNSGIDLFKHFRISHPETPALFMSGHCDESDLREIFELPCSGIIYKPFDGVEILEAIETILNQ